MAVNKMELIKCPERIAEATSDVSHGWLSVWLGFAFIYAILRS